MKKKLIIVGMIPIVVAVVYFWVYLSRHSGEIKSGSAIGGSQQLARSDIEVPLTDPSDVVLTIGKQYSAPVVVSANKKVRIETVTSGLGYEAIKNDDHAHPIQVMYGKRVDFGQFREIRFRTIHSQPFESGRLRIQVSD